MTTVKITLTVEVPDLETGKVVSSMISDAYGPVGMTIEPWGARITESVLE